MTHVGAQLKKKTLFTPIINLMVKQEMREIMDCVRYYMLNAVTEVL
jgi:hypothetical protein